MQTMKTSHLFSRLFKGNVFDLIFFFVSEDKTTLNHPKK